MRQNSAAGIVTRSVQLIRSFLVFLCLGALATGCAVTQPLITTEGYTQPGSGTRVLIMPPDIELSELTAGGLLEPNAAWTATGRSNVDAALDDVLAESGTRVLRYRPLNEDITYDQAHVPIVKLHEAVGGSILLHKYTPGLALPTKKDRFDWTLGPGVAVLRDTYDADYALFVFFRDSFASGGRVAVIVLAAVLGVGVQGGTQTGFASLVDLRTGNIVWFNRMASGVGDLREPDSARGATENLLEDVPL